MCKGYTPEYGQDMCHIMGQNLPYFKCVLCTSIMMKNSFITFRYIMYFHLIQ